MKVASYRPSEEILVRFPNGSALRIRKEWVRKEGKNVRCGRQGALSLRAALERSLAGGKVVFVAVPDIGTAIRHLCRMWAGQVDYSAIDGGAEVWGWTRDTPRNELDFRLILKGPTEQDV